MRHYFDVTFKQVKKSYRCNVSLIKMDYISCKLCLDNENKKKMEVPSI